MQALRRLVSGTSAVVLALSSMMSMGFTGVAHAAASNCTWTGSSSNNFNTAANWSNCNSTVPQTGDNLVFNDTNFASGATLNNNITGLSVGTITFQGSSGGDFTITGNALTVTSSIIDNIQESGPFNAQVISANITLSGSVTSTIASLGTLLLSGSLSGTGTFTVTQSADSSLYVSGNNSSLSGLITVNGGQLAVESANGFAGGGVHVTSGATLHLISSADTTFAGAVTIGGTGNGSQAAIYMDAGGSAGGANTVQTLSGAVTLTANTTVGGLQNRVLKVTGPLSGNYTVTVENGAAVSLNISSSNNTSLTPNGNASAPTQTVTVAAGDNQPNQSVDVQNNTTEIIDGQRGGVTVDGGGILKGTGQVNALNVASGGTVAPGHSPGKLTVLTTLTLAGGSTYQAELKDKNAGDFDQLVVGSASDTTGHDVTLGDGTTFPTLNASLYSGASIKAGDTFKIIDNLSQTPVQGTFAGLPDGTTFTVGSGTMKISYTGGDGNDVVLTAMSNISAPDTGFVFVSTHPMVTLTVTTLAAFTIFGLARKNGHKLVLARSKATRR